MQKPTPMPMKMTHLFKMIMRLFWLFTFGLVAACGIGGGVASETAKDRFLAVSFWQSQAQGIERIYYDNSRLMFKPRAKIAFEGDAVADYQPEIQEALGLIGQHFDLQVVNGYDPTADVNVYLYYGEGSQNLSNIKRENRLNQISMDRLGAMQYVDPSSQKLMVTNKYRPYGASEDLTRSPIFGALCETRWFYNDANLQANTFWQREVSLGQVMGNSAPQVSKTPDFSVVLGFMGVKDGTPVSPDQERWKAQSKASRLRPMAFPCIYEEIVHSLTFWRDLRDPTRVPFTGQYQGSPKRHADAYRAGIPEVQEMLSYYRLPGMRPGLSYEETRAVLGVQ